MAASTIISKGHHTRSTSLPSRPHALIPHCNELLSIFYATQVVSSSSSVINKLNQLKDFYDCVDELLQLPENEQTLSQENHRNGVDMLLDGSPRLLDICGFAKDALLQNKECTQELQSSLRRRNSDEHGIAREAAVYLSQRRSVKKETLKAMRSLRNTENITNQHQISCILSMLRQVQAATVTALESLLALIAGQNGKSTTTKWSLVSKLVQHKHTPSQQEETNEFEMADAAFKSLTKNNVICIENVQIVLGDLDLNAQDLEEGVESLFRQSLKLRVALLNFLNH